MKDVFYFKLYNSDDIVAEFIGEDEEFVHIIMPFRFVYGSNLVTGGITTSLTQWLPLDECMNMPIRLSKDDIVVGVKASGRFIEIYEKMSNKKLEDLGVKPSKKKDLEDSIKEFSDKVMLLTANTPSNYLN
jgi:hypothetical protein